MSEEVIINPIIFGRKSPIRISPESDKVLLDNLQYILMDNQREAIDREDWEAADAIHDEYDVLEQIYNKCLDRERSNA